MMKAIEFVTRLMELAPAKPTLLGCDYGEEEANRYIASFICFSRDEPLKIKTNGDAMLELLNSWDLSNVEIGPISFHSEPMPSGSHLEIGTVEGDRLVYCPSSGDYVLLEAQNLHHVMCGAAPNGAALLNGLLEIADYFAKTAIDEIDIDDVDVGTQYKNTCVQALGESEYESFCTSVFGF